MYFEEMISKTIQSKKAANWLMGSVKSYLNYNAIEIEEFPLSPEKMVQLIDLIEEGTINNNIATQKVFPAMVMVPVLAVLVLASTL